MRQIEKRDGCLRLTMVILRDFIWNLDVDLISQWDESWKSVKCPARATKKRRAAFCFGRSTVVSVIQVGQIILDDVYTVISAGNMDSWFPSGDSFQVCPLEQSRNRFRTTSGLAVVAQ